MKFLCQLKDEQSRSQVGNFQQLKIKIPYDILRLPN